MTTTEMAEAIAELQRLHAADDARVKSAHEKADDVHNRLLAVETHLKDINLNETREKLNTMMARLERTMHYKKAKWKSRPPTSYLLHKPRLTHSTLHCDGMSRTRWLTS